MPRQPRQLQPQYSYHVTTRCNNREFRLTRSECGQVFLYAIKKAQNKYSFKLYALCIMSNHVHYSKFHVNVVHYIQYISRKNESLFARV
ncbi:transposase, partial [Microcoleus sp. Pol11C2]|uniref:transposase n=1 Tax=Microcoleus sp. Pol11C2 TaxID=3055389 RepID=UPI002FD1F363